MPKKSIKLGTLIIGLVCIASPLIFVFCRALTAGCCNVLTYFRKLKEIEVLRTKFPDYVTSSDYVLRHYLPVHPVWFVSPCRSLNILAYQDQFFVMLLILSIVTINKIVWKHPCRCCLWLYVYASARPGRVYRKLLLPMSAVKYSFYFYLNDVVAHRKTSDMKKHIYD